MAATALQVPKRGPFAGCPVPDARPFVTNVSKDQAIAEAARQWLAPAGQITVPFNPVLINTGSKLILIDTGYGPNIGPVVGRVPASLAAAGITPTSPTACTQKTAPGNGSPAALYLRTC